MPACEIWRMATGIRKFHGDSFTRLVSGNSEINLTEWAIMCNFIPFATIGHNGCNIFYRSKEPIAYIIIFGRLNHRELVKDCLSNYLGTTK